MLSGPESSSEGPCGRWPLGSAKNIALGLALLFFQPAVPLVPFMLLRSYLYDGDLLRDPLPLSFAAALASFLPAALLVGGGLRGVAGVRLRALGFRADHLPREILLGLLGLALYTAAIFGW